MTIIGRVERLWRYPVKSMRGEELETADVTFHGIYGDRLFAFHNSEAPKTFPYLTARTQRTMLQYRPRVRTVAAHPQFFTVDVQTPDGDILSIDDPALIRLLASGLRDIPTLTLLHSDRAMTDCHPISLVSVQTVQHLGGDLGVSLDPRRFRANIIVDFATAGGFGEDAFVGKRVRLGSEVVLSVLERDRRCQMISLDPDSGVSTPLILQKVVREHDGMAGVYAAVLVEGTVRRGDTIELLD